MFISASSYYPGIPVVQYVPGIPVVQDNIQNISSTVEPIFNQYINQIYPPANQSGIMLAPVYSPVAVPFFPPVAIPLYYLPNMNTSNTEVKSLPLVTSSPSTQPSQTSKESNTIDLSSETDNEPTEVISNTPSTTVKPQTDIKFSKKLSAKIQAEIHLCRSVIKVVDNGAILGKGFWKTVAIQVRRNEWNRRKCALTMRTLRDKLISEIIIKKLEISPEDENRINKSYWDTVAQYVLKIEHGISISIKSPLIASPNLAVRKLRDPAGGAIRKRPNIINSENTNKRSKTEEKG